MPLTGVAEYRSLTKLIVDIFLFIFFYKERYFEKCGLSTTWGFSSMCVLTLFLYPLSCESY